MQLWNAYFPALQANGILPEDTMGIIALSQYNQWVMRWKRLYSPSLSPKDHLSTLQVCDRDIFPSIHALLNIAAVVPISTATVERSFSSLRLLKTYLRNRTCERRLTGLALMYIHAGENVDIDRVITRFASSGNRRLILL